MPEAHVIQQEFPASDAVVALRDIVGEGHVVIGEAAAREAGTLIPEGQVPLAYVRPADVEEVRRIVALANREGFALWPCSRGRNWGYGSATPARGDTVVMVLDRLDRIHHVDPDLACAVIEPGVTYRQLNDHLKAHGIPLWCDTTDSTPDGSVIGNAMEKGVGETPYGDHFANLCGLDVVLPDGRFLRTGGAPENAPAWNTYKWGTGPYLEGLFAQSNFGVVVRAGLWLMPEPEHFRSLSFQLYCEEDLPDLVDALRRLALRGTLHTKLHLINDVVMLSLIGPYPAELLDGATHLGDDARDLLRRRHGIAPWSFIAGLYGSRAEVRAQQAIIRRELGHLGRIRCVSDRTVASLRRIEAVLERRPGLRGAWRFVTRRLLGTTPEVVAGLPDAHGLLKGVPTERFVRHAYFKSPRDADRPDTDVDPVRDGCGLTWFAPLVPMSSEHVGAMIDMSRSRFDEFGFDHYIAGLMVNPRSIVLLMSIFYRKDDPDETDRARSLYDALRADATEAGYQQYRTTVSHESILDCAPEMKETANRIRAALDPQGIMAPGRYGLG
ncbi:MAG: hypothetical protein CMJ18_10050 [Phycisphaeraceae bacterium]|nr:hypothetical protein [Phycisphaeraceae bacterium]